MIERELQKFCRNLKLSNDGVWCASAPQGEIHYPDFRHAVNDALEGESFWFSHRRECLLTLLSRLPPSGPLFDVGGGNGSLAIAFQEAGISTVIVEPSARGVQSARARGVRTVIHADYDGLEVEPHTLPAVGLFDVLEHIADDAATLRRLKAQMVANGRLYLTVPAHRLLWSAEDAAAGHQRRYSLAQLQRLLVRCGFRIEYSSYFFSFLPLPVFLFRTVPSWLGLREGGENAAYRREIAVRYDAIHPLLRALLKRELLAIQEGKKISLGTSCLICASS